MSKDEAKKEAQDVTATEENVVDIEDIHKKRLRVLASISGGWKASFSKI